MNTPPDPSDRKPAESKPPGLLQVVASALAAAFGVQSQSNLKRDFRQGRAWHYIIAGLVFTLVFIILVISVVDLILDH